jgi:hypothetical protein
VDENKPLTDVELPSLEMEMQEIRSKVPSVQRASIPHSSFLVKTTRQDMAKKE